MTFTRFFAGLLLLSPAALAQQIHYVDAGLNTGADDGSSWANAYQSTNGLKQASNVAVAGDRIFVKEGLYRPAIGMNNRTASIELVSGVEIYGGFLGTESHPDERPPIGTAPSILDGDLHLNDSGGSFNDNSFHCIDGNGADHTAIFDGFVVRNGNANGTGNHNKGAGILCINNDRPIIRNCHFIDNRCTFGGAAGYINGAQPTFYDCIFENGDGGSFGGAFDIATGGPVLYERCVFKNNVAARAGALEVFATNGVQAVNCVFIGNRATSGSGGGGFWCGSGGTTTLRNCTFYDNRCPSHASGGARNQGSVLNIINCVFWQNQGTGGAMNANNQINGGANVSYTVVQGGLAGTGNLNLDPMFVDAAGGDLRLAAGSPCIDAASNAGITSHHFDAGYAPRRTDDPLTADTGDGTAPLVDMGAYEHSIGSVWSWCVPNPNSTGMPSILTATGSPVVADNDVNFVVRDLPTSQFAYFLMSETSATIPVSSGILCLGGPQVRFNQHVLNSGGSGSVSFSPDLNALPQAITFQAGETWHFQLWHRDGSNSNFSSELTFTWQ